MTAESYGRRMYLKKLPSGGVAISVDTDYGPVPILAFPTWGSFAQFTSAVEDFYNEMKLGVPDVFEQAFNDNGSS